MASKVPFNANDESSACAVPLVADTQAQSIVPVVAVVGSCATFSVTAVVVDPLPPAAPCT